MKIAQRVSSAIAVCLLSIILFFVGSFKAFAYTTIGAEIPVNCLGVSDDNTHIYTIKIESENDNSPAPNSDTLEISENGTGRFEINISEPGTYNYKIYEIAGDNTNIEYDSNIYHVTLFVENSTEDELIYTVIATIVGKDGKPEKIDFEDAVLSDNDSQTTTTIITTTVPDTTTVTETTADSTPQTTAVTTTVTTTSISDTDNPFTGFIDSVLTGDSFPVHAVRMVMLSSIMIAISTFLFKRDNNEEEDKNEK